MIPPLARRTWPLIQLPSELASYETTEAMSVGSPSRCRGARFFRCSIASSDLRPQGTVSSRLGGCVRFSSAPCFHKRCCSQIVARRRLDQGACAPARSMGEHSAERKSQRPDLLQPVGPATPTGSFVQRRRRRSRRSAASATGCWRKQPPTPGGSARLSDAVAEGDPSLVIRYRGRPLN
jgi:hypothetical protein